MNNFPGPHGLTEGELIEELTEDHYFNLTIAECIDMCHGWDCSDLCEVISHTKKLVRQMYQNKHALELNELYTNLITKEM